MKEAEIRVVNISGSVVILFNIKSEFEIKSLKLNDSNLKFKYKKFKL